MFRSISGLCSIQSVRFGLGPCYSVWLQFGHVIFHFILRINIILSKLMSIRFGSIWVV